MNFDSAFAYLESFANLERLPGGSMRPYRLDRMKALLNLFGNPQEELSCIHISGSKGKGSTGLYIACALEDAGFETGLYASPHVQSYRERISKAGKPVPDELLVETISYIRQIIEAMPPGTLPGQNKPTTFELLTLLAYLTFVHMNLKWAVIETGLGGRLDATNVLHPIATVHTPVELEHTDVLGNTIEAIASEKAGIIKPHTPAYCGLQRPEATAVFATKAAAENAPFMELVKEIPNIQISRSAIDFFGLLTLKNGDRIEIKPGMMGAFQVENASLAFLVADSLLSDLGRGKEERRNIIRNAIARSRLPGRMELLRKDPPILIDAAHTPSSAARLMEAYVPMFPGKGVLIFGSVIGKNPAAMAATLASSFRNVLVSTPGTFKPSDPASVEKAFKACHPSVELILDPKQALLRALELAGNDLPILVTGSFYMISEIRRAYLAHPNSKAGLHAL